MLASTAVGQMVTGSSMENFAGAFGLSGKDVEIQQTAFEIAGKPAANVLWPREKAGITFHVKPSGGYKGQIKFDVVHYGTRSIPGDIWKPHVFKIADISSSTSSVDLQPQGGFVFVKPKIGEKFGGYAIILDLPGKGRFFGATCCRAMAAEPGRVYMPSFAMDLGWPFEMSPAVFNAFKKMGIKGARTEGGYHTIADAHTDWAMDNDVTLMLTVGCGGTPSQWQPLGRGRPWLNRDGSMRNGVKEDLAWMPARDPEFKAYLKANESRDFGFTVIGGIANDTNNYPLLAVFDGRDGKVEHAEVMHVNYISRRTIAVDGNLDDWKGAVPQTSAQAVGLSISEQAYLPFKDWNKRTAAGPIAAYLAYDDKFFYFAARVPAVADTIRYGTRDDDSFFYPEKVTDKGQELTWPAGVRRYSYRKDVDLPSGHNVQIAFNVVPQDRKAGMLPFPAGTMPHFCAYQDTDYEFALNRCRDGGTEIFCLTKVGAPRKHFYPRQPKALLDGGPLGGAAKLVFKGNVLECAIPWRDMPEVYEAIKAGRNIKFTFRSNEGGPMELAAGRSVSKDNPLAFHADWTTHWANELEFGAEK